MIPGRTVHGSGFRVQGSGITGLRRSPPVSALCPSMNYEPSTMNQVGFTFVEVMIVLVVIGILVTLATPSFTTSVHRAREAALRENLFVLRDVIDQHYADQGAYPPTLDVLVEKRYLRKIPKDPITGLETTWVLVPDTDEHGVEVGIFDVKSGSDQLAMDGTVYSTW